MKVLRSLRRLEEQLEGVAKDVAHTGATETRRLLRNVGWISAGVTALAIGLVIGRELRQRYKFNRRTPYDFYAHSGDCAHDVECGVGI